MTTPDGGGGNAWADNMGFEPDGAASKPQAPTVGRRFMASAVRIIAFRFGSGGRVLRSPEAGTTSRLRSY